MAAPKKILFVEQIFIAGRKWGQACGSPPKLGALTWVAAAYRAMSLCFVLVAVDREPLRQQLYQ